MNPTLNFVFLAVIVTIVLVALDVAFLRLRTRQFEQGQPLVAQVQAFLAGLGEKLASFQPKMPQLDLRRSTGPQPAPEPEALSALVNVSDAEAAPEAESLPVQEATPAPALAQRTEPAFAILQTPVPENGSQAAGRLVRVQVSAEIPEGTVVHITIQAVNGEGQAILQQESLVAGGLSPASNSLPAASRALPGALLQPRAAKPAALAGSFGEKLRGSLARLETQNLFNPGRVLFLLAILVYFLTVTIGIDRFPIYFFTDEAVHMNLASEFVERGFTGSDGSLFPTYFSLGPSFALNGVSVYVQVIPYILFGKSVLVIRLVSALITLLGAILVSLLLKQVFKIKAYWLGILLLITSPAWFLHSRTAFEYMEVASFFAAMLYFYNRYRQGEDQYLYATVFAAALTFYTHGLGQLLAGLTTLLFFFSDLRYHFQPERRRTLLLALGLGLLLALPYLRYNLAYPEAVAAQIKQRNSYWVDGNFTLAERIFNLLSEYFKALNPGFWFLPNATDLDRHKMLGYGNLLGVLLPFAGLGLGRVLMKWKQTEYRSVLLALLAAPIPAAIVAAGTPRLLWMIVPWVILMALGLDLALEWLSRRKIPFLALNLGLFLVLSLTSFYLLADALTHGPTWFTDYGLYGMQYGAKQVFAETVVPELRQDPEVNFIISPTWANGTDQFAAFFVPQDLLSRVRFGTPNDLINDPKQMKPKTIFILTADEFGNFSKDEKIKAVNILKTLLYPNGKPGFYLVTIEYPDNIQQIIANEHEARRKPVEDTVTINGQVIKMLHSPIGGGNIMDTFDDNPETLTRVTEANPYVFDLYPDPPLTTNSLVVQTGSLSDFTVTVELYAPGAAEPVTYSETFKGLPPDPLVTLNFDRGPAKSSRIYLEIKDNTSGETSQIHVRTVQFK